MSDVETISLVFSQIRVDGAWDQTIWATGCVTPADAFAQGPGETSPASIGGWAARFCPDSPFSSDWVVASAASLGLSADLARVLNASALWPSAADVDTDSLLRVLVELPAPRSMRDLLSAVESIDLTGADLRGVDLTGADLNLVNLNLTDLRNAQLPFLARPAKNFLGANLEGANLEGAYLEGASLQNSSLVGIYARRTDFTGADLTASDLRAADLRDADLTDAVLAGATYDKFTRWPEGFNYLAAGAVPYYT